MGSGASMVSKAHLEFKSPPDYWVTPKWLFHINKDGEFSTTCAAFVYESTISVPCVPPILLCAPFCFRITAIAQKMGSPGGKQGQHARKKHFLGFKVGGGGRSAQRKILEVREALKVATVSGILASHTAKDCQALGLPLLRLFWPCPPTRAMDVAGEPSNARGRCIFQ